MVHHKLIIIIIIIIIVITVESGTRVKPQGETSIKKHSVTKNKQLQSWTTPVHAGLVGSALIFIQGQN